MLRVRITFTPNGAGYTLTAPTRFDKLFTGIVSPRPAFVAAGDGRGTEHLTPADTRDQDYDELLERVCEKGLAPRRGFALDYRTLRFSVNTRKAA
ncbi:MAG: hypothetical protein MUF25_16075 [Pirellulaceae bacterium]|nr:hypothetical protein [Pirellulaceae bacterium]